jgi:hypothetical protein
MQTATSLQDFWRIIGELRCPIGVLLFKAEHVGSVADIAARCNASIVDFRQIARQRMGSSRYVGFTPQTLSAMVREVQSLRSPAKWLVTNFDLALARLKLADRILLWSTLVSQVTPNSRATVVLAMPDEETAVHLLPPAGILTQWTETNRAFRVVP